jgi:hypothetical protein
LHVHRSARFATSYCMRTPENSERRAIPGDVPPVPARNGRKPWAAFISAEPAEKFRPETAE